jgi:hypothetical protein
LRIVEGYVFYPSTGGEIEETAEAIVSNEASAGEEHASNRPKTPQKNL